jgi:glycosyltransferase involved in cell wall biosynthesis
VESPSNSPQPNITFPPEDLVTVIVPAYNAAATIDETLLSVRAQSHACLEIIVVDDGSVDSTAQIVERHAQADARVALIRHPTNKGVAAARNTAIAAAKSDLIAPIDADDLWHPLKIERQVAAMRQGGRKVGLIYTWSALLDAQSRVTALAGRYLFDGNVLTTLCEFNLVGNGSSPLMRADAVKQAGGYDSSLVRLHAQGCEDWALYLAIAESFEFVAVPEYLTGYRSLPASMSTDASQMWRSFCLVEKKMRARRPELGRHLREGLANMCHANYRHARATSSDVEARALFRRLIFTMPYQAFKVCLYRPLRNAIHRRLTSQPSSVTAGVDVRYPADWPVERA